MSASLTGWTVKDWSIRPRMLATINLWDMRLRPIDDTERRFAKWLFARPSKIIFSKLSRGQGVEFVIENVTFEQSDSMSICKIRLTHDASIEIFSIEQQLIFF